MCKNLFRENIDFIRIFLFFSLFKSVDKTCFYFSISRTSFLKAIDSIEKTFEIKLFFDRKNYTITKEGKYFFDYSYKVLTDLRKFLNLKKNFLDIAYTKILSNKDILEICKFVYTNSSLKLSFISTFEEEEILKLIYLDELDFGIVSILNKNFSKLEFIKLNNLSSFWNLYSKKENISNYAKYIYNPISELFYDKNVIIESNNLDFIIECIMTEELCSYLPECKYKDIEENLYILEKTDVFTDLYLVYNKNIVNRNFIKFIEIVKKLFCYE